jgi:hypothetical protein
VADSGQVSARYFTEYRVPWTAETTFPGDIHRQCRRVCRRSMNR